MDKWLNHPTALKIFAVAIALLIWAVVHIDPQTSPQSVTSNRDTKVIEAVPIIAEGLDTERYVITAMEPTVTRLVVEGRISTLLAATNDDYVVKLDLTDVEAKIQKLPLTVEVPAGIDVVELSPSEVTIQIAELETQTQEVKIITEGTPAEGYQIGESTFIGDIGNVVEITMPKEDYALLGMVAVTVDVTGAEADVINKKAKVVAYDTQGNPIKNVTVNPETLAVQTKITLPTKEVPVQLRYTGSLPEGYSLVSINTQQQAVSVFAPEVKLDEIELFDGYIVDLSKVKETGQVTVKADKVEGVAGVKPEEIPVNIVIEQTEERVIQNVPVSFIGLNSELKAKVAAFNNGKLDVNVKGASSLLQRVRASDIKLSLDLTGLEAGTHKLTIDAELPAYIQVTETEATPLTVEVELSSAEHVEAVTSPNTEGEDSSSANNSSSQANASDSNHNAVDLDQELDHDSGQ